MDYLSYGALELVQEYIWNRDSSVLIALGGHDQLKQMQTGIKDKTPLEERRELLRRHWKPIFQHEPISTGNPEDAQKECLREYDGKYGNFYDKCIGKDERDDEVTKNMYHMIIENADIIKGICYENKSYMIYRERGIA